MAWTTPDGQEFNISKDYSERGISRGPTCTLQSSWGMHQCMFATNYSMLIIESMDENTDTIPLSPVAIMSDNGYIDLINGPANHGSCYNRRECRQRISTFMAIVQSGRTYQIYFSYPPPKHLRFRLINSDSSIRCVLAVYYNSLQQIDVYANNLYVSPTNRNTNVPALLLLEQNNTVTTSSPAGTNYFDRFVLILFSIENFFFEFDV